MDVVEYIVIFVFGTSVGFFINAWLLSRFKYYAGTLVISREDPNKTTYSLVLEDYLENLEAHDEVIFLVDTSPPKPSFNIDTSKESPHRE